MAPAALFVLAFVLTLSVGSSSASDAAAASADEFSVSRTSLPYEGGVAVVVQLSDLHFSVYDRSRDSDLLSRLPPLLRSARPDLLLITGDLSDAKNRKRTSSRQDEAEWSIYKNTINSVADLSGLDKNRIFDIRGNHDKYGVPYVKHKFDFFSTYSVSALLNRVSTTQSIMLQGSNRRLLFLGLDDSLSVGIRYPANLFGHISDERIKQVDSELQYWRNVSTKVIYGHFPLSFIYPASHAKSYESMFAAHSVSAFICGHLHATFTRQLWWLHTAKSTVEADKAFRRRSFWEWELGDWKDSRLVRILTIDEGALSFHDFPLQDEFQTKIIITYPTDSRNMNTHQSAEEVTRNDINTLVLSSQVVVNVTARIFDSHHKYKVVEEVSLLPISNLSQKPMFHGKWNAESYKSTSPTRYWLQVFISDSSGKTSSSERRPFSVTNDMVGQHHSWTSYLLLGVEWDSLYKVLLWSTVGLLLTFLILPKFLSHFMGRDYQRWMSQVLSSSFQWRKAHHWLLLLWIEGSSSRLFSFSLIAYMFWLINMPWLWGHATSEGGEIVPMYLSGWWMPGFSQHLYDKLGNPDLIAITLPFLCLVVAPTALLIYSLFATETVLHLQRNRRRVSDESTSSNPDSMQLIRGSLPARRVRMLLLAVCCIVTLFHFKRCTFLMSAYGVVPVLRSASLVWIPPVLLGAAVYTTS